MEPMPVANRTSISRRCASGSLVTHRTMPRTAEQAYAELIRRVQGTAPARLLRQRPRLGRADLHAAGRARPTAPSRWPCSPASTHEMLTAPEIGELLRRGRRLRVGPRRRVDAAAVNVREIRRGYDRAVKLPKELVEELARRHDPRPAGLAGGPPGQTTSPRFSPGWKRSSRSSARRRRPSATTSRPTTPCSTSTSRAPRPRRSRSCSPLCARSWCRWSPPSPHPASRPRHEILEREYPGRPPADLRRGGGRGHRLRLRRRPARRDHAPVLQRHRPRRLPDHHALQPAPLQRGVLRHPARGRPRHLRAGPDPEHFGTPLGSCCSLGIHESQSRLWENQVGRGRPFWEHFFPRARQVFRDALRDVTLDDFVFAINDVQPSFIRVEADEATYNLHIILRFELEQALISGDLTPADVPGAWNEKFQQSFGLTPPDDAQGCLQDIHWSMGGLGYFPTYTLGNLYAAQFMEQARQGPRRPRRRLPPRRVRPAEGLAQREDPPARPALPGRRTVPPRDRQAAQPSAAAELPAEEVRAAVWHLSDLRRRRGVAVFGAGLLNPPFGDRRSPAA